MGPEEISELPEREAYVNSLLDFHRKVESDLTKVLEKFHWNSKHFLAKESASAAACKFCPNHRMPVESLQKHEDVCQWIQQGYTKEELENEVPSSEFFYEKSKIIPIKLDKEILNRILDEHHRQTKTVSPGDRNVPQTLVASKADFTQAERLAIYEYVVRRSKEMNCMQSMPDDNLLTMDFEELIKKSAKSKVDNVLCSEAEKWAAMRDYKRRRQSYRAKNVHITKKTYTEIIREVIHNQVDLLQEGLKSEPGGGEKSLAPPEDPSPSPSPSSSQKERTDSERKAKRHSEDDQSRYKSRSYPRKKSRESPDRRQREGDKRSVKTSDPQHSDKYGRDRASPDLRKRDHKSLESHDRRDRGSPDRCKRTRRSSPPSIRDKERRSPDYRKRDKEYRKSRSDDPGEQWKKHSRNNLEGPSSEKRSKPEHETQLLLLTQPPPPPPSVVSDEALLTKESQGTDCRFSHHKVLEEVQEVFGAKALPKTSHRRTSSSSDDEGSSVSHRHKKHSKSKKHKKHKHKSEKRRN